MKATLGDEFPQGLTAGIIGSWLSGHVKTAKNGHLEAVNKALVDDTANNNIVKQSNVDDADNSNKQIITPPICSPQPKIGF